MKRSIASFLVLAAMLCFAAVLNAYGVGSLLYSATDRGADFLKVVLALPGPPVADGPAREVVQTYAADPSYRTQFDLFHLTPLSMLASLIARQAFSWLSPVIILFVLSGGLVLIVALALLRLTQDVWWALCAMVSYPLIFAVDRGNLYAMVAAITVIVALVRQKADWAGAVLFAIAACIRPNAIICAIPLMFLDWRFIVRCGISSALISAISLAGANALYTEYTLSRFAAGIARYESEYLRTSDFVAFRSSGYGALFALGYPSKMIAAVVGLLPLVTAILLHYKRRLTFDEFTFICMASMVLMTAGFADYHLLIFIAPLVLATNRAVAVASLLILAPKGVWMVGEYTIQVFLNPAIMLTASIYILVRCGHRPRYGKPTDHGLRQSVLGQTSVKPI